MNVRRATVLTLLTLVALLTGSLFSAYANDGTAGNSDGTAGNSAATTGPTERAAPRCLNFDDLVAGTQLIRYRGVSFTNSDGGLTIMNEYPGPPFTGPNAVLPDNYSTLGNRTRATFPRPVNSVQVTQGDYNSDADDIFLEAYNSAGALLDSAMATVPASLSGGITLVVTSAARDVAYVEFYGRGLNATNSVYFDNLCVTIPV